MTQTTEESFQSMQQVMRYCVDTPNRGLFLNPFGVWKNDEELIVMGMSDAMFWIHSEV
jgi:hypothetical protein